MIEITQWTYHWAPSLAADLGIPSAFIGLHNTAALSFFGPPSALHGDASLSSPDDFTIVPNWIPFPSTITYRPLEARELFNPGVVPEDSGVSESYRFFRSISDCRFVAVRSCNEFESGWLDLLPNLYNKPVIPFCLLPPPRDPQIDCEVPFHLIQWSDNQAPKSVVYVAFGSQVKLSRERVHEIALGLELSKVPFFWALRAPEGWLPEGFERRNEGRGLVLSGWAPQLLRDLHGRRPSISGQQQETNCVNELLNLLDSQDETCRGTRRRFGSSEDSKGPQVGWCTGHILKGLLIFKII
ncbi:hypothetical protein J5N97_025157 [Dioscorea zingiberensis]|uniref:Uncharacterized protein n=1 Tax=Dioscorea zingiberensis TaxID=325984 RepID=A0A9D5C8E1_9LILI|nr:hypothetical protein J5N97_025157 [Dioscorea zingiberensis]